MRPEATLESLCRIVDGAFFLYWVPQFESGLQWFEQFNAEHCAWFAEKSTTSEKAQFLKSTTCTHLVARVLQERKNEIMVLEEIVFEFESDLNVTKQEK